MRRAVLAFLRREGLSSAAPAAVLDAVLLRLAAASDEMLLVALEDIWLETEPQNIPGVSEGHPNWRRKSRLSLEQIADDPRVRTVMRTLSRARRLP